MTTPDFTNMTSAEYDEYARQRDAANPPQWTPEQLASTDANVAYHEYGLPEEAVEEFYQERLALHQKRIVAIGNRHGVTAVAPDWKVGRVDALYNAAVDGLHRLAASVRQQVDAEMDEAAKFDDYLAELQDLDATLDAAGGRWGY